MTAHEPRPFPLVTLRAIFFVTLCLLPSHLFLLVDFLGRMKGWPVPWEAWKGFFLLWAGCHVVLSGWLLYGWSSLRAAAVRMFTARISARRVSFSALLLFALVSGYAVGAAGMYLVLTSP